MPKNTLLLLFLVLSGVASAAPGGGASGNRIDLGEWRYSPGDGAEYADPGYDDSGWRAVSLPAGLALKDGRGWLRGTFDGYGTLVGEKYLLLGRVDAAAEVYLNGSRIGRRGTLEPGITIPGNQPGVLLLPPGLWKEDGGNLLALRLAAPATVLEAAGFQIGDGAAAEYERRVIAFFNFDLYTVLGALCAFIGLYFLALWAGRTRDTPNLWYAVSSFAIAFYFVEIGATYPILEYTLNRALAKACLTVSMASLAAFFLSFFEIRPPRVLAVLLALVPVASVVSYLAVRGDYVRVDAMFNRNLIFVQAAIVFIVVVTVREVIRGNREAVPILVGVILGVGLGTHDVVYSALGRKPVAWLQGIGFFALNLSLFVTLTLRSSRLHAELQRYSVDVEGKTRQLADYIGRIEQTADSVSAITAEIDSDAAEASESADALAAEAGRIGENADRQVLAVRDSGEAVERLGRSLGLVRSGVDSQAAGIEGSAEAVGVVAEAAASVAANVSSTADFARGLEGTAERGREASRALDEAIARIKDAAGEVVSIVGAVEEFAERTDLLSMNAAIEAAHAGAAGRGFAVIAEEIKSLAEASTERAALIRESISDIVRRIENGVEANAGLASALDSVAEGARTALEGILTVSGSLEAQRGATDRLRISLRDLAASAAAIRAEAERQDEEGGRIRDRMSELVSISDGLRQSIGGIARENARIAGTIKRLAEASRDGKEAVAGLRRLLETRDDVPVRGA